MSFRLVVVNAKVRLTRLSSIFINAIKRQETAATKITVLIEKPNIASVLGKLKNEINKVEKKKETEAIKAGP